jgi:hypothetical protein
MPWMFQRVGTWAEERSQLPSDGGQLHDALCQARDPIIPQDRHFDALEPGFNRERDRPLLEWPIELGGAPTWGSGVFDLAFSIAPASREHFDHQIGYIEDALRLRRLPRGETDDGAGKGTQAS